MRNKSYFRNFVLIPRILFRGQTLEINSGLIRQKTLKPELLRQLSIEIYEILDLTCPDKRQKSFVFYFMLVLFFSSPSTRGTVY